MKLIFLARQLSRGGAERQLVTLAAGLAARGHQVKVATFYGGGALESDLVAAGVPLIVIGKSGRWDVLGFLVRLVRLLRAERPDLVHGYLPVPNVLATLCRPLVSGLRPRLKPRLKVVWGVRASNMLTSRYDWLSRLFYAAERCLAAGADLIIANSAAGAEHARDQGFPSDRLWVIANGIDTDRFSGEAAPRFSGEAAPRTRVRTAWGFDKDQVVIGLPARLDPMKDHPTFLAAAALVAAREPRARFVCVGDGPADYRADLADCGHALGLDGRLIWAGPHDDMPAVYSGFDLGCSASAFGEGFSNALAEMMACGVPCVATEVGDARRIIGVTGEIVPPGDAEALAAALLRLLERRALDPAALAAAARARILNYFSVAALVERSEAALLEMLSKP
ncbi:Glycosyl transferase, group 1 [uncultured Gammaproteobacteria bacterium]